MSDVAPVESILPREKRDAIRAEWARTAGFYNPWVHLGVTSIFGSAVIALGFALLHDVHWWDVAFGFGLFVLSNATEWRIHRDLLHKRLKPFHFLYDQHTPMHHMVFVTDDMEIRNTREFRFVLIPAYAIVVAFFGLLPGMWLIWHFNPQDHNLAAVFGIETMGYIVSYEWLHLSYHLPENSFVGRLRLVRFLRKHHAIHHDPRLMQKWNFNVSLPLWDLVRRTYVRDRARVLRSTPTPV